MPARGLPLPRFIMYSSTSASAGLLYAFHKYFVLETWVTQPIHDHPASYTLKLNFVLPFGAGARP